MGRDESFVTHDACTCHLLAATPSLIGTYGLYVFLECWDDMAL